MVRVVTMSHALTSPIWRATATPSSTGECQVRAIVSHPRPGQRCAPARGPENPELTHHPVTNNQQIFDIHLILVNHHSVPKTLPMLLDTSPICCPTLEEPAGLSDTTRSPLAIRLKALADPVTAPSGEPAARPARRWGIHQRPRTPREPDRTDRQLPPAHLAGLRLGCQTPSRHDRLLPGSTRGDQGDRRRAPPDLLLKEKKVTHQQRPDP